LSVVVDVDVCVVFGGLIFNSIAGKTDFDFVLIPLQIKTKSK